MRNLIALILLPALATGATADEKILAANGTNVELIDATTLNILKTKSVGPGDTRAVAVSFDRRYALVTQDGGGGRGPAQSLVILDLTQPALPEVTRLGGSVSVRSLVMVPGGKKVLAGGVIGVSSGVLLVVDMTTSPPSVKSTLASADPRNIDVTPDGTTAFAANANNIEVIDLLVSPPAIVRRVPAPTNGFQTLRVSPDGRRLVVLYPVTTTTFAARVFDLSIPQSPQQIADINMIGALPTLVPPAFDPGNAFALVVDNGNWPSPPKNFHVLDVHAPKPREIVSITVGGHNVLDGLTVTRDGLRALVATGSNNTTPQLREVDVQNPSAPQVTSRTVLRFNRYNQILSFGEVHAYGPATIGTSYPVYFSSPNDAGKLLLLAASFSPRPGIPLGKRMIPLVPDALFAMSRTVPAWFQGFTGVLDSRGQATGRIAIPALPGLRGTAVYVAGVVIDPAASLGVGTISNAERIVVE